MDSIQIQLRQPCNSWRPESVINFKTTLRWCTFFSIYYCPSLCLLVLEGYREGDKTLSSNGFLSTQISSEYCCLMLFFLLTGRFSFLSWILPIWWEETQKQWTDICPKLSKVGTQTCSFQGKLDFSFWIVKCLTIPLHRNSGKQFAWGIQDQVFKSSSTDELCAPIQSTVLFCNGLT